MPSSPSGCRQTWVGASVEVRADNLGDLLRAALGDGGVDQPVGATVGDVGLAEAEAEQVLRVVAQPEIQLRVVAGDSLGARRSVSTTHANSGATSLPEPSGWTNWHEIAPA
jgi:hypothetical protein